MPLVSAFATHERMIVLAFKAQCKLTIQQNKEKATTVRDLDAIPHLAPQRCQLISMSIV
jgi:hypothetical protein